MSEDPGARGELFPHGSDIGIRGHGPTPAAAFEAAAGALTRVITDPSLVKPRDVVEIQVSGEDPEMLFYDWINALVAEMSARSMLFSRFEVEIANSGLRGRAFGENVDVRRHRPAVEVKGATMTCLEVRREPDGAWLAQCVVDV